MIVQEFSLKQCDIWFIRFDVCIPLGICACGDTKARIALYAIGSEINRQQPVDPEQPAHRLVCLDTPSLFLSASALAYNPV